MKRLLIGSSLFLFLYPFPVYAQLQSNSEGSLNRVDASAESASSGNIDATNLRQIDSTNNTSTVGGTVNNVGVNNSSGLLLPGRAIQDGVECEVPMFEISAVGTSPGNGFDETLGILAGFRIPLRSSAQRSCEERSELKLRQAQLDTLINLTRFCIELDTLGYTINEEESPIEIIQACNLVTKQ